MNDIVMIFAQGFMFVGKPDEDNNCLRKAMQIQSVNVMGPNGLTQLSIHKLIGDLFLPLSQFPRVKVETKTETYQAYIEQTTGIAIQPAGVSH